MKDDEQFLAMRLLDALSLPGNIRGYAAAWAIDSPNPSNVELLLDLTKAPRTLPPLGSLRLWAGAPRASANDLLEAFANLLSSQEIERARRFRYEADTRNYLAAHAGTRLMLATALNCAPSDLRFDAGPHGKPTLVAVGDRIPQTSIHFSLSHSGDRFLIGLGFFPLGVDIEAIRAFPDQQAAAEHIFSTESRAALAATREAEDRNRLFYRFWVLSEAYIKATGLGLTQELLSFGFTSKGPPRLVLATPGWGPPERWSFGLLGELSEA